MVAVNDGDTLKSIAQRVYGNSSLWYVLADANALKDDSQLFTGQMLKTPQVKTNKNDSATFKPYNPAEVIGPTEPGTPYIAKPTAPQCNAVAMILMVVIAIVVTVFTAGAAAAALAPAFGGVVAAGTTTMALGAAALTGGLGAGFAGLGMAAAAIGAFVGSVASQVVGKAMGVVDHFSLRQAVGAGIAGGLSAGIGSAMGGSTISEMIKGSQYGRVAVSAAAGSLASYAGNRIAGVADTHFSWKAVAATTITAVISAKITNGLTKDFDMRTEIDQFKAELINNSVGGIVGLHVRRKFGFDDKVDYGSIAADAFGNALGNAISGVHKYQANRASGQNGPLIVNSAASQDSVTPIQAAASEALGLDDDNFLDVEGIAMEGQFGPGIGALSMAASLTGAGLAPDTSEVGKLVNSESNLIALIRQTMDADLASDVREKELYDDEFDSNNILQQAIIVAGGVADNTWESIKGVGSLGYRSFVDYATSPVSGIPLVGTQLYALNKSMEFAGAVAKLSPYLGLVKEALQHQELGPMLASYGIEKWRELPAAEKYIAIDSFIVDAALTLFTGYGAAKLAERGAATAVSVERAADVVAGLDVNPSALTKLGQQAMELVSTDRRLRALTHVEIPGLDALKSQLARLSYSSKGKSAMLAALEKNPTQAASLSRAINGVRADEARGMVFAFERMQAKGYSLLNESFKYGSNNGIDMVFRNGEKFAILEAKHGGNLKGLSKDAGKLRQGSWEWIDDRLAKAFKANPASRGVISEIRAARGIGDVESYAAFYRSERLVQLNYKKMLGEIGSWYRTIPR
jgi:hypothetical protein